jgi:hypothetical protein
MTIEEQVRRALVSRAELVRPVELDRFAPSATDSARGTDVRKRVVAALVAAVIGVAGIAVVVLALGRSPEPQQLDPVADFLVPTEIQVGPGAGRLAVAFGSVWIATPEGVVRVDPSSGEILASIPVRRITAVGEEPPLSQYGGVPRGSGLAAAAGLLWVTAEPDLVGIDPATNEITHRVTEESGITNIAAAGDALLVGGMAEGNGDVRVVDPLAKGSIYLGGTWPSLTDAYPQVLASRHWFWAASGSVADPPAVSRQLKDLSVLQTIEIPAVRSMTEAADSVWITTDDALYRVDASKTSGNGYQAEPDLIVPLRYPSIVAGDDETLWLLEATPTDALLSRLNLITGERVGDPIALGNRGPAEMAVDSGKPFITFAEEGVLVKLGGGSADSDPPVRFLPGDGWVIGANAGGEEDPVSAWTSNVEMTTDGTFPALAELPDDGVLLTVTQVGDEPLEPDDPNFQPAKLPLTSPEGLETSWEGYVEGTSRHKLWVAVKGRALDINIYYGTTEPTDEQLAAAQSALERLVVSPAPDEAGTFLDEVTHLAETERWAPDVTTSNGLTTMPITFPDGATADLRYPSELGLERYGVYPDMYARLDGSPDVCGWPVHATRYDPRGGWVRGERPLDTAETTDGRVVELWEGTKSNAPHNFLITRIGAWNVIVACRGGVIDGDVATWAEKLSGPMTGDGLLVMRDSGLLDMHPGDSGATVRISGDDIVVDISVSPDECVGGGATDLGANDGVVEWCVGRSLHVYANAFAPAGESFLQDLVEGLEVDAFRPAPD